METNPKNIFIGMLFAAIMIISGISISSWVFSENPESATGFDQAGFNNSMNYYDELQNDIGNMSDAFTSASSKNVGILGSIGNLIQLSWTSITTMFSTMTLMSGFIGSITLWLGLPLWLPPLLFAAIIMIVVIWAIVLIFRS